MTTGNVTKVEVDKLTKGLSITLQRSEQKEDNIVITFAQITN